MRKTTQLTNDILPWNKSLKFKLMGFSMLTTFLLSIIIMFILTNMYRDRIDRQYNEKADIVSKITASPLTGETIDYYLKTLIKDKRYEQILGNMSDIRRESGAKFIYVLQFTKDGALFVFDTDEEAPVPLGGFDAWGNRDPEYLKKLLRGETVEPYISSTKWGWLLTGYAPVLRADKSVAAYVGVDISMDEVMQDRKDTFIWLGFVVFFIFVISGVIHVYIIQKMVVAPVNILIKNVADYSPGAVADKAGIGDLPADVGDELDVLECTVMIMKSRIDKTLKQLFAAEEHTKLMLDSTPLCCQLWDGDFNIINCNEAAVKLYGFKNKQEYQRRFFELMPEYQPDGQRSEEKIIMMIKKAFDDGSCVCDWMYQTLDGKPLPAESTFVRVGYKNGHVVAGYMRDLRVIKKMEENIVQLEKEADKIYYDPLTGIYNRRYLDENLKRIVASLSRSNGTLSLMMIDIDFFKNFNDTYGHSKGDECLKIVAEAITKSINRANDFAARYGGEEFVVVLPNTEEEGARLIADRLLDNMRSYNVPPGKTDAADCVTFSIGLTTGKVSATQSGDDYIRRADELLYRSKQSGRNRYTFEII